MNQAAQPDQEAQAGQETPPGMLLGSSFLQHWRENPPAARSPKYLALCLLLTVIYFVAGKLGLRLAFFNASATPVWPPAGIALAAFLLLGVRVWPAILMGAFLVNLTTAGTVATSLGIALGNTAEGLVGAYLVRRFAGGWNAFHRAQDIFRFALLAAVFSTAVSATVGVTILALGGFANWADYRPVWLTWWLGDAVGDMVVAPLLLMFIAGPRPHWSPRKLLEAVLSAICLWLIGLTVFGEISLSQAKNYPLEFLCIPFLIWVAFRFSQCEAAMAVATLSGIAIWGTLHGFGPFVRSSANESLLLLQAFMGVVGVMTIAVAAVVSERKRVEEELRSARDRLERQAASDPLTGLANYRRLVEVYTAEVERSDRTGRPFALLLFDLDGLKKINDTRGHLVGSRALCRVAEVLRLYCRSIDTAARYGGDEFAVLLPETGAGGAQYVAGRIVERVARDKEAPSISVSVGIAVHPDDGKTIEEVFETADAALYSMKNAAGKKRGR